MEGLRTLPEKIQTLHLRKISWRHPIKAPRIFPLICSAAEPCFGVKCIKSAETATVGLKEIKKGY
jgi:hypothetical protein